MNKLSVAPVPADLDLRYLPDMPLSVVVLRDSDIASVGDPEIYRCATLLWCASWHQVPAGSLPNDEATQARLAGLGRDVRGWRLLAPHALRGFAEGPDGRLYHRVVCEKAVEVHNNMAAGRWRKESERIRYLNKRNKDQNLPQVEAPAAPEKAVYRWELLLKSGGQSAEITQEGYSESANPTAETVAESAQKTGKGKVKERKRKERKYSNLDAASSSATAREPAPVELPKDAAAAEPVIVEPARPEPAPVQPQVPEAVMVDPSEPAYAPHGYEADGVTPITSTPMPALEVVIMPSELPKAPPPPPPPNLVKNDASDEARAFNAYNQIASLQGWPQAMFLNSTVRFNLQGRLAQIGGIAGWTDVLIKASGAKFLREPDGKAKRWVNLDWIINDENFRKLMEGRYDQNHDAAGSAKPTTGGTVAALARLAQEGTG